MNREFQWRRPTPYEAALLRALCSLNFPENDTYMEQTECCEVTEIDEEGQLAFRVPEQMKRASKWQKPVAEARFYQGSDWASFLLHVRDGELWMLEKFVPNPTVTIRSWEPTLSKLQWYTFGPKGAMSTAAPRLLDGDN